MKCFTHTYDDIICVDNLLSASEEFIRGKKKRKDVQAFQMHLMDNILKLHVELKNQIYIHGAYGAFNISDPKPRNIHKARVRDRLLHHALYRQLYPYFDTKFISHSYSCRNEKGTHRALDVFARMAREVSVNHTKTVWVLKCDIKKFFASIDHVVLQKILAKYITDTAVLQLLENVIASFETKCGKGLPLGNLTSQLLVNIYMNEFDQYVKRILKQEHYIRYADDFVFLSRDKKQLQEILRLIAVFLREQLELELHPSKVFLTTFASGVDFLGWVHFPTHRVLRTTTKRRMLKRVGVEEVSPATILSYIGLLEHGNAHMLQTELKSQLLNGRIAQV
jgi:retron-type reverse transcriptase